MKDTRIMTRSELVSEIQSMVCRGIPNQVFGSRIDALDGMPRPGLESMVQSARHALESRKSRQSLSILVAEDDPADRYLIRESRSNTANEVAFVNDGVQAMQYMRNEGAYTDKDRYHKPDLLILDLNMPKMDGRAVLKEVKNDPLLCGLPVVILTTSQADEDRDSSYQLGASSYITKPQDFEGFQRLMSTLENYWLSTVQLPV